ncbi:MAG: type II secretion system GspH family protein [bacterium]|nr:type II secretion system GspH family protein [bacterium]
MAKNPLLPQRACRSGRAGFTLVEVLIAIGLLLIMAVSLMATLTLASRYTRLNSNAIAAKNIAQSYFERMAIDDFKNVDADHYPNIDYDAEPPVWLDHALDIRCKVEFSFSGFGELTDASASNLTDNNILWTTGQWNSDTVFLVAGAGAGQHATIDNNTPNTLHLVDSLSVAPKKGTKYMINYGKTVRITTYWQYMGKEYSQTIESLVPNYRNSADFGF